MIENEFASGQGSRPDGERRSAVGFALLDNLDAPGREAVAQGPRLGAIRL
jgi:hypothetical protein